MSERIALAAERYTFRAFLTKIQAAKGVVERMTYSMTIIDKFLDTGMRRRIDWMGAEFSDLNMSGKSHGYGNQAIYVNGGSTAGGCGGVFFEGGWGRGSIIDQAMDD